MARWTRAQVEGLAPDDKSVAAALKLAKPGPWSETGSTDTLLWGKCQGSGKTPYQVSVDLTGPAVKCSCPSRKFPCKHGLALLFLWVEGAGAVAAVAEPADYAGEWASDRAQRAEKKTAKRADDAEPADPEARARRLERRLSLMTEGAADFELWLADLYRHGLAAARQRPYQFWDDAAARLTDAQIPGLAARVRVLPETLFGRDDWADAALAETGRWFTAVRAWQRRDRLADVDLANLRAFLGWPVPTAEVLEGEHLTDSWLIEGVHRTDDGRLQSQRTWVRGTATGQRLAVLDFAAGTTVLRVPQMVGSVVDTPLAPYPGSGIRRAMFVDEPATSTAAAGHADPLTVTEALETVARVRAKNPFTDRVPVTLSAGVVVDDDERAVVADTEGAALPLIDEIEPWELLAHTGGAAVPMFAEIDRDGVRPLSIELDGRLVGL